MRSTRKILNCVINRTKRKPIKISSIQDHDVTITDSEEIANRFSQYFANVGPNLASKTPPPPQPPAPPPSVYKSFNENLTQVTLSSL